MKTVIPLQRIEQVNIKCTSHNVKTDYYNFEIIIEGCSDTKVRFTADTIEMINDEVKNIVKKIRKAYND